MRAGRGPWGRGFLWSSSGVWQRAQPVLARGHQSCWYSSQGEVQAKGRGGGGGGRGESSAGTAGGEIGAGGTADQSLVREGESPWDRKDSLALAPAGTWACPVSPDPLLTLPRTPLLALRMMPTSTWSWGSHRCWLRNSESLREVRGGHRGTTPWPSPGQWVEPWWGCCSEQDQRPPEVVSSLCCYVVNELVLVWQ